MSIMNHTLAGFVAAVSSASALPAQTIDANRLEHVTDSIAKAVIAEGTIPGVSIAIAQNGRVIVSRAYGIANVERNTSMTRETAYGVTSITKQFTAAFVMKLVEQGKIALDDPLTKYLPDFPVQGDPVTIRHLLNHTSGIFPLRSSNDIAASQRERDITYTEMVAAFGNKPVEFKPGEKRQYNNFGYYLLGEVIRSVTSRSYKDYVETEMKALGLDDTRLCDAHRPIPDMASSYAASEGKFISAPFVSMHLFTSWGGLCSTANDLIRWNDLLHGGRVISAASLALMTAPTVLNNGDTVQNGFGIDVGNVGTHRKLYHGGTSPWGAFLAYYPEDKLSIAVLTNSGKSGRMRAEEVENILARTVLGTEIGDVPLTKEQLATYEGTYMIKMGGQARSLRVYVEDGVLKGQAAGGRVGWFRNQGNHTFIAESGDIKVTFQVANNRATKITIHQSGMVMQGDRVEAPSN
jgi:D-alanyl-D-alanine carboxypeptidase